MRLSFTSYINLLVFFLVLNTLLLSNEHPQKITPKDSMDWKYEQ